MRKKLFLMLVLLCAVAQGAWSQEGTILTEQDIYNHINNKLVDWMDVKLDGDIVLSQVLKICPELGGDYKDTEGTLVGISINLNGHKLSRHLDKAAEHADAGSVLVVNEGCRLRLYDTTGGGTISGGWGIEGGGITNYGTLQIDDGVTICDNKASVAGGGICSKKGPSGQSALTIINSAKVKGNQGMFFGGSGICNNNDCRLVVNEELTVTGNSGGFIGSGIYNVGTLELKGAVTIADNFCDKEPRNLYLAESTYITFTGALESNSKIGVHMTVGGEFTKNYATYNLSADAYKNIFFCDKAESVITPNGDELFYSIANPTGSWLDYAEEPSKENGTYLITTAAHLAWVAKEFKQSSLPENDSYPEEQYKSCKFQLMNDINLSEHKWYPIGAYGIPFSGEFDGQDYTISGLVCEESELNGCGLFGAVGYFSDDKIHGSVSNVKVLNSRVQGKLYVGGICGFCDAGTIENCFSDATVSGNDFVGGIIGYAWVHNENWGEDESLQKKYFPVVKDCLYTGTSVKTTGTIGAVGAVISGAVSTDYIVNNYYTEASLKELDQNAANVLGYPCIFNTTDVTIQFEGDPQGVTYNGVLYIPQTGAKISVTSNVSYETVTDVLVNDRSIFGTGTSPYAIEISSGETSAVITVKVASNEFSGSGTESAPYLIESLADWELLAKNVSDGNEYEGKCFRLDAISITTTTMVGTAAHAFKGSFDGNDHTIFFNVGLEDFPFKEDVCAPFRYYGGSSIKNLTLSGNIYTNNQYVAGLVGKLQSDATIEDCISSMVLHTNVGGDAYAAGFVAWKAGSTTLTFNRCLFNGWILGLDESTSCSGFLAKSEAGSDPDLGDQAIFNYCMSLPCAVSVPVAGNYMFTKKAQAYTCSYYIQLTGEDTGAQKAYVFDYYHIEGFGSGKEHRFFRTYDRAIWYQDKYYSDLVPLNKTDNKELLSELKGQTVDASVLYIYWQDGSWNTICLPFDVAVIKQTRLAGATVKTLESSSFNSETGALTLNFTEGSLTSLVAGKPYLIKWSDQDFDVMYPTFTGVTLTNEVSKVETNYVDFVGDYSAMNLAANDKTVLYLGAGNKLYYPSDDVSVYAFRAYFKLKGITAGDLPVSGQANARAFVLNFGDESTGITTTNFTDSTDKAGEWYDLQGRRLNGQPTTKGIYINNGKVIIK